MRGLELELKQQCWMLIDRWEFRPPPNQVLGSNEEHVELSIDLITTVVISWCKYDSDNWYYNYLLGMDIARLGRNIRRAPWFYHPAIMLRKNLIAF